MNKSKLKEIIEKTDKLISLYIKEYLKTFFYKDGNKKRSIINNQINKIKQQKNNLIFIYNKLNLISSEELASCAELIINYIICYITDICYEICDFNKEKICKKNGVTFSLKERIDNTMVDLAYSEAIESLMQKLKEMMPKEKQRIKRDLQY